MTLTAADASVWAAPPPGERAPNLPTAGTPSGKRAPNLPTAAAPTTRASTAADAAEAATVFQEALSLKRKGQFGAACVRYEKAVRLTPNWPIAQYELAQCTRLIGDLNGTAKAHIEAASSIQKAPIYIEMGRLAEDAGDTKAAVAAYEKALDMAPAEIRARAGLVRLVDPKDKGAIKRLERYLTRYPNDIATWRKLARVAEAKRKRKLAFDALMKVVELSPNKRAAAGSLGAFGQRTRNKKAIEAARKAYRQR